MTATWYPIIDEKKCVGCMDCANFCPHGVLAEGNGMAEVVKPLECVEFCRGCQKICDAAAISYFGDASS